jgi:hypothetical protein
VFIHFNSKEDANCGSCDRTGTIMAISIDQEGHSSDLCMFCFRAMARVFSMASKKLRLPEN